MASLDQVLEVDVRVTPSVEFDHLTMVAALFKPGKRILDTLTPLRCEALHAAVGVSGEAGELLDAVKKWIFYNKDVDRNNVVEELGDLEFYMEAIRSKMGISREETLKHNMEKLAERYKKYQYSDQAAVDRADKQ
jgi:NTP pyrophosphatase (non-canonical NTP hydrolase)